MKRTLTQKLGLLGVLSFLSYAAAVALCMMLVGAVGMNSGIFNNPFLIWGRYRRGLFRTTLPLSFQFHHTQMDGAHAGRFLQRLQEGILALEKTAAGAGTGGA